MRWNLVKNWVECTKTGFHLNSCPLKDKIKVLATVVHSKCKRAAWDWQDSAIRCANTSNIHLFLFLLSPTLCHTYAHIYPISILNTLCNSYYSIEHLCDRCRRQSILSPSCICFYISVAYHTRSFTTIYWRMICNFFGIVSFVRAHRRLGTTSSSPA